MKLIGKLDDMLVYEVSRGKYVIIDPERERWMADWTWYGQLGRFCDTFTKCSEDEDELKGVEVIEKNKDKILEALNNLPEADDEIGKDYLKEQDEFYDSLEDGREFDWSDGDYVED